MGIYGRTEDPTYGSSGLKNGINEEQPRSAFIYQISLWEQVYRFRLNKSFNDQKKEREKKRIPASDSPRDLI